MTFQLLLLGLCLLGIALGLPTVMRMVRGAAAAQGLSDNPKLSEGAQVQIKALLDEKARRTPAQQKLDSQLLYAVKMGRGEEIAPGVRQLSVKVEADQEARTIVDITAIVGGTLIEDLEAAGAEVLSVYAQYNSIRARVPLSRLEQMAGLPQVRFIQPKQEPRFLRHIERGRTTDEASAAAGEELPPGFLARANRVRNLLTGALDALVMRNSHNSAVLAGSQTSEGDVTHRAAAARTTFGANGAGVRVGVLSDGVASLAASQASGDLPSNVVVLPGLTGNGDEGTAMLEIINDLAPGARLYFATADGGPAAFAQAIRNLRTAGCDIIVDDVAYFAETPLQDGQAPNVVSTTNGGVIWQAVNDVTASGALYFSSAGNEGNKNDNTSGTWQGDFVDGGTLTPSVSGISGGTVNDFGSGTQFNTLTAAGSVGTLFWSDPLGGSSNDYDLFVLNSAGTAVVSSSTNLQNGSQDPVELVGSLAAGNRLVILKKTGAANRFLSLMSNGGRLSISTDGAMFGHACAAGAFGVAATPAANAIGSSPNPAGPFPNPFSGANVVELFSSDGPRRIFFNANGAPITPGNLSATGGTLRQKPDITAADGVSVTGVGGFPARFFGTSAAAPHAAAIAALLRSANPALTSTQVRTALTTSAIDIEGAGVDRDSGAGIIMAFQALQSIGATAAANLQTGTVAATEAGGNGNTFIEPGENAMLSVQLLNTGLVNATGISATLTTSTPGVVVTAGTSAYANLTAATGAATNTTPFAFNLTSAAVCPLRIDFTLTVTFAGAGSPRVLPFTVQTGQPPLTISSTLDSTPPASGSGYTATTGLQNLRLARDGQASLCGSPETCPGTFSTGTRRYDAYNFSNCSTTPSCVNVALNTSCTTTNTALYAVAYLGSFDPSNVCANYLADPGDGPTSSPANFSFTVPAGANFIVVVHEVNADGGANCPYTLTLSGLCCQSTSSATCPTVSQLAPATGVPGSNVMITGTNLGNVNSVKFASGVSATFSVVNNSTLNVVIPNGGGNGPIKLSSPGCADAQTAAFSYPSNLSSNNEIAVDDGTMEFIFNVSSSGMSYFVNRLTPTSYPATVTKLAIFFPSASGAPPSGTPFDLLVGVNPGGGANIDGTKFTATPASTQPGGIFSIYNVPPQTITSGDFVVGFRIPFVSGVFPAALDTNSPSKGRSYYSGDGATFTIGTFNFGFRAATLQGCQNISADSPSIGPAGTPVTIAGTNLNGVSAVKFFNSVTAQFTVASPTQIITTVPNTATTGPITISKSSCPDMTAPVFVVGACPTVTSLNTNSGAVGASVTITGTNLSSVSSVKFANNVTATFTAVNDTTITASVPNGAVTGPITISKTNCPDAQTASFNVTVPCPTVTGITTASGSIGGSVAITGTNFTGVTAVKFANNVTAQFTVNSATSITATVPAGAVTGPITISKTGCPDVQTASFTVCSTITITPASLPDGTVGTAYNQTVTALPALTVGNYNFSVTAGALPAGLSLNATTGVITGTPTAAGTANFTITATGSGNCTGSQAYSITVQPACPAITITPASLSDGTSGTAYNQNLTASGGTASYSFAVTAGALANGLTLSTGGVLSGTPTAAGTFAFTITATDANGCTGTRGFTLTIASPPLGANGILYALNDCNGCPNQIYGFAVNEQTGALSLLSGFPVSTGGNGGGSALSERLAIDRVNRRLYAINDASDTVSAYSINATTGALTALPFSPISLGIGNWVALAVHPSGSPLVVGDSLLANHRMASYLITATTASPVIGSPFNTGSALAFSAAFSRDGNFLYTGGSANNGLFAGFSVNATTGVLTALAGSPFDSGANNPVAYATDASGRLFVANVNAGQVRAFTTSSGIPSAVSGNPFTSGLTNAIHGTLHPNGFYLVADQANRVGVYQIGGSGSATTLSAVTGSPFSPGGIETDVLALNQAGTFLFAADSSSRSLKTLSVNPATGVLAALGTQPNNTLGTSGRLNGLVYFGLPCDTISLAPATLPNGTVGTAYSQTVMASPAGSYTFTITAGALPAGLSLNSSTGAITGTPTAAGTTNFTITATNPTLCTGSQAYTMTITAPICPTITGINPASGSIGSPVTINGNGFTGVSLVRFGSVNANFVVVNDNTITASVPSGAVTGPITISKPSCNDVQSTPFTILPATSRLVRVVNASGTPGGLAVVPIELVSQGDENALGFSLTFDPAILGNPQVSLGVDAAGGQLNFNPNQIVLGRFGIVVSLASGQHFNAGVRRIAVVTFTIAANVSAGTTNINFGDQPIVREISDLTANILLANYAAGSVTIASGYEADVTPRPNGSNDGTVTVTDYVQIGRFVAGLDTPLPGSEFQRADCAPRSTLGDGKLSVSDWVQAGRYTSGLDPVTPAGGPSEPASQLSFVRGQLPVVSGQRLRTTDNGQRTLTQVRASQEALAATGWMTIELDAQGGENALGFSLQFDPARWRFVGARAGRDANGAVLNVNLSEADAGRIGLMLALPAGQSFAASLTAGLRQVAQFQFAPIATVSGHLTDSVISFTDQPLGREVVGVDAEPVLAEYAIRTASFTARVATTVSAASFKGSELASESIAAVFGAELATATQAAEELPLPFELAGTHVTVKDSEGIYHSAPLFFVSPGQVNYLIPAGTASGWATVTIISGDGTVSTSLVRIAAPTPGLFAASSDGRGIASALLLRLRADGSQQFEPVLQFDPVLKRVIATPIDSEAEGEQTFLVLFGTGLRRQNSPGNWSAKIGGLPAEVLYVGPVPGFAGLDQCNLRLPHGLAGRGEVDVSLSLGEKTSNLVNVVIK